MDQMPRIYIIGPVNTVAPGSECDQFLNVRRMVEVATDLVNLGMVPVVPALCSFWHMLAPQPRSFWMAKNDSDIRTCNAALRMPGDSLGADADGRRCEGYSIPVFTHLEHLARAFSGWTSVESALVNGVDTFQSDIVAADTPGNGIEQTAETPAMHIDAVECEACQGEGSTLEIVVAGIHAGSSFNKKCADCDGKGTIR